MGWCIGGESEGYVVALVEETGAGSWGPWLRELGPRQGDDHRRDDVAAVQAGCECGWRGPRHKVYGFHGVAWHPYCPDVASRELRDGLRLEWRRHYPRCPLRGPLHAEKLVETVEGFLDELAEGAR